MKLRTLIFALVVSLMLFQVAYAEPTVEFGGDVEVDWTVGQTSNGSDVLSIGPGSAALFGVTARNEDEDGLYVEAYGEGEWELGGGTGAGDVYVEIGNPTMNLRLGNCGNDDMFIWGEDFYVADAGGPAQYDGGYVPGTNMAYVNFNASDALKVQFGARLGSGEESYTAIDEVTLEESDATASTNVYGVRPVVTFSTDTITVGAGAEYLMAAPQDSDADGEVSNIGFGGYVSAALGNITVGGGGAMGTVGGKSFADDEDVDDVASTHARGFATFAFGEKYTFGVAGGFAANDEDLKAETIFGYAAFYIQPFMIDGLRLQLGASFASATVEGAEGADDDETTATGGMIRFEYSY